MSGWEKEWNDMILLEDVEAALPSFVEVKEAAVQEKK